MSPAELESMPHGERAVFADILPLLASPDTGNPVSLDRDNAFLVDGERRFPLRESLPIMLPTRLLPYFSDQLAVPIEKATDAFLQYFLLASIKHSGEISGINAPSNDVHFQRHLYRMKSFMSQATGLVLDVGCDDTTIGCALLPSGSTYLGLDPFCRRNSDFRVVGVGEFLPFQDRTFDAVVFNTSLDHIFDWRQALDEAMRVLRPDGTIYISTLVWLSRATLISDSVHFHHFREHELFGALDGHEIIDVRRYSYKEDDHRYGLYLAAKKSGVHT